MDKKISFGKRPKNPHNKRVWKDMLRDWKRYLMIGLMLIVTIGFVSGMYVANNSMLNTLDKNVAEMKREDGHFTLSKKADEATVKAIETGAMADVPAVYRERAYDEAVEEKVAEQVKKAIKAQVTAAIDEKLATAKAMGADIPAAQREEMISSALDTAIKENYDNAYDES